MRYLIAITCALAIVSAHLLYGGLMRPVFALPAFLLVGAAGLLCLPALWWRNIPAPVWTCVLSVIAFAGWLIWREMETPDAQLGAAYLRLTLACLVMYLIFACVLTIPYHRLAFVCVIFAAAIVQASLGAWQFAHEHHSLPLPWMSEYLRMSYSERWGGRGHGFYLSGNHLVWLLNTTGIVALSLGCWGRWGAKAKVVTFYVALMSFGGAILTLSRGGAIALAAGFTVFFLLSGFTLAVGARDRRVVAIMLVLGAAAATVSVVALLYDKSFLVRDRFQELLDDGYRPGVFAAALRQWQLEPLLGTGAGTFVYYGRIFRETPAFSDDIFAHNDWLQLGADFGLPAIGLLVLLILLHLRAGLTGLAQVLRQRMAINSRPQSHAAALQIGALCVVAMYVAHSFLDFNMQVPANALLAAALLGILANCGVEKDIRKPHWMRGLARYGGGIVAVLAGACLIGLVHEAAPPEILSLQAENALLRGEGRSASVLCEEGVALAPRHARLQRLLGESFLWRANVLGTEESRWLNAANAAKSLEKASELASLDSENRMLLGEALMGMGKFHQAAVATSQATALNPKSGRGYEQYADILVASRRREDLWKALRFYEVSRSLAGAFNAQLRMEEIQRRVKREAAAQR